VLSFFDLSMIDKGVKVDEQAGTWSTRLAELALNLALVVLLLVAGLAFLSSAVGLARGGDSLIGGRTLEMQARLPRDETPPLPKGVALAHAPTVTVKVKDPSTHQLLLSRATTVGPVLLAGAVLLLLRRLVRSVKRGEPFSEASVRDLRLIAGLLIVGGSLVDVANWGLRVGLAHTLPHPLAIAPGLSFPPASLLAGLGALVLAEVFAHGNVMREDLVGTL
jgi:hypothetical protein